MAIFSPFIFSRNIMSNSDYTANINSSYDFCFMNKITAFENGWKGESNDLRPPDSVSWRRLVLPSSLDSEPFSHRYNYRDINTKH